MLSFFPPDGVFDCCLCDGYPVFETRELHEKHFLGTHFLEKIDLFISSIDSYDKLLLLRKSLGITFNGGVSKTDVKW